ncbi:MAG: hypothetical protein GY940_07315 [bacterium]|nr:hypothetical protein [bacterium]
MITKGGAGLRSTGPFIFISKPVQGKVFRNQPIIIKIRVKKSFAEKYTAAGVNLDWAKRVTYSAGKGTSTDGFWPGVLTTFVKWTSKDSQWYKARTIIPFSKLPVKTGSYFLRARIANPNIKIWSSWRGFSVMAK